VELRVLSDLSGYDNLIIGISYKNYDGKFTTINDDLQLLLIIYNYK